MAGKALSRFEETVNISTYFGLTGWQTLEWIGCVKHSSPPTLKFFFVSFHRDTADRVVQGQGKFEEIMACAHEIAASTAQLVVSSKVKADRNSRLMGELGAASKEVNRATGKVVASAKSAAEIVEDQSECI